MHILLVLPTYLYICGEPALSITTTINPVISVADIATNNCNCEFLLS